MHRRDHPLILPAEKGTYVLILRLEQAQSLTIGRLGTFDFKAGFYAYVGSAFGSGGLAGRLKHHLSAAPRPHWHIDYLRQAVPVIDLYWRASETRYECTWAAAIQTLPGVSIPIPRFGASDCRCPSHLFYFAALPVGCHAITQTDTLCFR